MKQHRALAIIALCLALPILTFTRSHAEPVPAPIAFVVNRDGKPIGTHRLTFHTEPAPGGERLIVDIAIDIKVKVAFVTVYVYTLEGRETWQNGRLLALDTRTNDNGTKFEVHARATPDGIEVQAADHPPYVAPADMLPDSYWQPDTVRRSRFIDIENGQLIDLVSTPAGHRPMQIGAQSAEIAVYHLAGELTGELGYAADGQWVLLHFPDHGDILYTREAQ